MATFEEAIKVWTETINDWYDLHATEEETQKAFEGTYQDREAYDGTSYVDMFFKRSDGSWTQWLDTSDREGLADEIERLRGNPPLPTYGDIGSNILLLNKVSRRSTQCVDPFGMPEDEA
jgi:hypothetical protein|tara:strand:- start:959 stop:1315 length:357 start_codon:yes stop_codon:yes gene_type:complete